MSIKSTAEFEALRRIGRIVRNALDAMAAAVRPGISTAELDGIAKKTLAFHGAESSPPKVYGFPGTACISVNEEAIHGIPSSRVLKPGDLVKLDLTAEKAFQQGARFAYAGNRVYDIGRAVEREVRNTPWSSRAAHPFC